MIQACTSRPGCGCFPGGRIKTGSENTISDDRQAQSRGRRRRFGRLPTLTRGS